MNFPETFSLILETSLRVSLVLAGFLLVRPLLRRFVGGHILGLLWLVLLVRLLIPAPVLWPWAVELPWLHGDRAEVVQSQPESAFTVKVWTEEIPYDEISAADRAAGVTASSRTYGFDALQVGAVVWLIGLVAALGLVFARFVVMRRISRRAQPLRDPRVLAIYEAIPEHLRRGIALRISREIAVPALAGVWRPEIWLPAEETPDLSDAELRHILLHELGHARRGDLLVHHLFALAACLHWFNPLVWLAFRAARADREIACDAWVLSQLNPNETADYGKTLMKIIEHLSQRPHNPANGAVISMAATRRGVFARMRAIKTHGPVAAWRAALAGLSLTILLLAASASYRSNAAESDSAQAEIAVEQNTSSPVDQEVQKKLKTLVIPQAEFREVSLSEAVNFLEAQSKQLDESGQGLDFVLENPDEYTNPITLNLKDVSLFEALKYVTKLSDAGYEILDGKVLVGLPKKQEESAGLREKLETIILPEATFDNVTLEEGLKFLTAQSQELDPTGEGVTIIRQPDVHSNNPFSLTLRNVSLKDALDYIGRATSTSWTIYKNSVLITPQTYEDQAQVSGKAADTANIVEVTARFIQLKDGALNRLAQEDPQWARLAEDSAGENAIFSGGMLTSGQLDNLLAALNKPGIEGVDLLSAPRVVTKSGQRAMVQIAQAMRYAENYELSPDGDGRMIPKDMTSRDVGVTMEVEPILHQDGKTIDLNIIPELVELAGYTRMPDGVFVKEPAEESDGRSYYIPIFTTQQVSTSVTVEDGQSFVVGGMKRQGLVGEEQASQGDMLLIVITAKVPEAVEESNEKYPKRVPMGRMIPATP